MITKVVLVGPRAAGKSTLARALGPRLGWPVVDTDERLAERVGHPAGVFLAAVGEREFRGREEAICLEALAAPGRCVVALGGGAVLSAAVRTALRGPGVLAVLVEAPAACLAERQRRADVARPSLTDLPLEREVEALLRARLPLYETVAQLRVNTFAENVDACIAAVMAMMGPTD